MKNFHTKSQERLRFTTLKTSCGITIDFDLSQNHWQELNPQETFKAYKQNM